MGSVVSQGVFAEHHNSIKDAIINLENNVGLKTLPAAISLNGILRAQENRYLAPRAIFRAYPTKGVPGTQVRFQNFSTGPLVRYLWDFGDGTVGTGNQVTHTYTQGGSYLVTLTVENCGLQSSFTATVTFSGTGLNELVESSFWHYDASDYTLHFNKSLPANAELFIYDLSGKIGRAHV